MKIYIICTGIISQFLFVEHLFSQSDVTKTTTTTTTDITPATTNQNLDEIPRLYIGARYMPIFTRFAVRTIDNRVAETSFTMGYGAGGYLGFNLSRNIALQAEVIYSQLSQKYKDQNLERTIGLNYLYVPLLVVLNSDITRDINFNVTAGPQFGINMGAKISSGKSTGSDTLTAIIAVKPVDFGIAYGAGFDFRLGPILSLDLGFRGMHGLIDISDKSNTAITNQYYILYRSHVNTYAGYIGVRLSF